MVFNKPKRVFVAYANQEGQNEFLIRDGKNFYVLLANRQILSVSPADAYQTLKLIKEQALSFRGIGSFRHKLKKNSKGVNK